MPAQARHLVTRTFTRSTIGHFGQKINTQSVAAFPFVAFWKSVALSCRVIGSEMSSVPISRLWPSGEHIRGSYYWVFSIKPSCQINNMVSHVILSGKKGVLAFSRDVSVLLCPFPENYLNLQKESVGSVAFWRLVRTILKFSYNFI